VAGSARHQPPNPTPTTANPKELIFDDLLNTVKSYAARQEIGGSTICVEVRKS
jgi:hypothetical protein